MEMNVSQQNEMQKDNPLLAGKYLTFKLDHEEYGIEIMKVQEIVGIIPVNKIPGVPDFMRGVVNLRGRIIPVIELRAKFKLEEVKDTERTCIIVVEMLSNKKRINVNVGVIVDEVAEVLNVTGGEIDQTPYFENFLEKEFILGMAIVGDNVKILLDINKILTTDDLNVIEKASSVKEEN